MAAFVFNGIELRDGIIAIPGQLKVDKEGLAWSASGSDKNATLLADEVEALTWLSVQQGLQLKCTKTDGDTVRFAGSWDQEAVTNLNYHSKEHFNVDIGKGKVATKGWNWGMPVIGPNFMTFDVDGTEAFEVPLGQVTQVCGAGLFPRTFSPVAALSKCPGLSSWTGQVTENKHEVALEFTPDDGEDGEQLVEMRFFVPPSQVVEEPTEGQELTPAQELL